MQRSQSPRVQASASTAPTVPDAQSARPKRGRLFSCLGLLLTLLSGMVLGLLAAFLYISSQNGPAPIPTSQSTAAEAAIVVHVSPTYLSQVVAQEVNQEASTAGIPGSVNNIQVKLTHNAPVALFGDDQVRVFGIGVTKQISMQLQPVIRSCHITISVINADFGGIPVTSFVTSFEQQINQQIASSMDNNTLPPGFTYCVTNVRTEVDGLYVTYSAQPS